jgi:linoleoyl-CoA desaturase
LKKNKSNNPVTGTYIESCHIVDIICLDDIASFYFSTSLTIAIAECFILGLLIAAIGFNVMHDGSHGSFSTKDMSNKLASYSMSMLGASHFFWNIKHNVIHHTYTNVEGMDDDIEVGKLMRLAPEQARFNFHKYQHIYFPALYVYVFVLGFCSRLQEVF